MRAGHDVAPRVGVLEHGHGLALGGTVGNGVDGLVAQLAGGAVVDNERAEAVVHDPVAIPIANLHQQTVAACAAGFRQGPDLHDPVETGGDREVTRSLQHPLDDPPPVRALPGGRRHVEVRSAARHLGADARHQRLEARARRAGELGTTARTKEQQSNQWDEERAHRFSLRPAAVHPRPAGRQRQCAGVTGLELVGTLLDLPELRCVRGTGRAPEDLHRRAGFERAPGDVQTP